MRAFILGACRGLRVSADTKSHTSKICYDKACLYCGSSPSIKPTRSYHSLHQRIIVGNCNRLLQVQYVQHKPPHCLSYVATSTLTTQCSCYQRDPPPSAHAMARRKPLFDAWNGYHSVPIRELDCHFTTLITPWGRYRCCTPPQDTLPLDTVTQRHCDEIVSTIPNKTKCFDDMLIWVGKLPALCYSYYIQSQWLMNSYGAGT